MDLRCVASPYGGEPMGFCTLACESRLPGVKAGDCVGDSRCGYDETEGCCHINYVEGLRGAGFCVPFPLQPEKPEETEEQSVDL